MPTNFHVSPQPALRCVSGESYPLAATNPAASFFTRLRVAERLVIHGRLQPMGGLDAREWFGRDASLVRVTGFRKGLHHA